MKEKLKALWDGSGKWFLIGLPVAALVIGVSVWQGGKILPEPEKLLAVPATESEVTFDMEVNRAYTSEDGIVVIQPGSEANAPTGEEAPAVVKTSSAYVADPEQVWTGDETPLSTEDYTLPQEAQLKDGSMGVLTIPKINLSAQVYESEDGGEMESMTKGIAHFAITSAWDGNIGLCSHNVAPNGAVAYFRALHLLEEGDTLTYKTALGERSYKVSEVREIAGDDWSYLMRTEDNRLTMITCITGKPDMRLMVQATEA